MPPTPAQAMEEAVNQIALTLIARGAARAHEMISRIVGAQPAPANTNGHAVPVRLLPDGTAEPITAPTPRARPAKRVRYLKRVDLGPLKEKLLTYIIAHPGQRSEEMMPKVRPANVRPDAVLRALQQLSAEKWVTTEGVARGTKYTAAAKLPMKIGLGSSKNLPEILRAALKKGGK